MIGSLVILERMNVETNERRDEKKRKIEEEKQRKMRCHMPPLTTRVTPPG
jgi:hypothetical protein